MQGYRDIKLFSECIGGKGIHGFYRTKEGRDFLRLMYPNFQSALGFKSPKIAAIISDKGESAIDEINSTAKALDRWNKGQDELWSGNSEKNMRILKNLELEMMSIPTMKEKMDDRAVTIAKLDAAHGLTVFTSGLSGQNSGYEISQLLDGLAGVYCHSKRDFTSDESDFMSLNSTDIYCLFSRPQGQSFLLTHEFKIIREHPSSGHFSFSEHLAGFSFLDGTGKLFRFLVSCENPAQRIIDVFVPVQEYERKRYVDFNVSIKDHFFYVERRNYIVESEYQPYSKEQFEELVKEVGDRHAAENIAKFFDDKAENKITRSFDNTLAFTSVDAQKEAFIVKRFENVLWDIPL